MNKFITIQYTGKNCEIETDPWIICGFEGIKIIEGQEIKSQDFALPINGKTKQGTVLDTPFNREKLSYLLEAKQVEDVVWYRSQKQEQEDPIHYETHTNPETLPDQDDEGRKALGFKSRIVKRTIPATYKVVVSEEEKEAKMNRILEMLNEQEARNFTLGSESAKPVSVKQKPGSLVVTGQKL